MPLFCFHCDECGHRYELLLPFADADTARCPECGAPLHRLLTAPSDYRTLRPRPPARTCCGAEERCDTPPCSDGGSGCCPR